MSNLAVIQPALELQYLKADVNVERRPNITEKGSLNARLIRERRRDLVDALYSDTHTDVIKVP